MVDINGMVSEGRLIFNVGTRMGPAATRELGDSLKVHLIRVIEHCMDKFAQTGKSYTPSDFSSVRISQALLDRLQSQ